MKLVNGHENLFVIKEDKMLSIYTTENIVTSIFQDSDNRYDAWYDFITKLRPTMNVLLNEDTDYEDNDYNPVYMFEKDYDIDVEPEFLDEVGENAYLSLVMSLAPDVINDPHAIFLLDIDESQAKLISEKYGVICHSFKSSPSSNPIFQDGIEKNVEKKEKGRGWHELLPVDAVSPSNSLVFVDRYLFSKDSDGITGQDGVNNAYEVLNRILPAKLGVEYHILFVFDASTLSVHSGDTFESISMQLNNLVKRLARPYNIVMESVSIDHKDMNYDETHNRRILSNYFIVRVDRSLKAFRPTHSLYSQSMFLDWGASKGIIHSKRSDAPAKALGKYIKEVKIAIGQLKKSVGQVPFAKNGEVISINDISHRFVC